MLLFMGKVSKNGGTTDIGTQFAYSNTEVQHQIFFVMKTIKKSLLLRQLGAIRKVQNLSSPRSGRDVPNQYDLIHENGQARYPTDIKAPPASRTDCRYPHSTGEAPDGSDTRQRRQEMPSCQASAP